MLARTRLLLRVSSPAHAMRLSGGGAAAAVVGGQSVANELRPTGVGVGSWGGAGLKARTNVNINITSGSHF